MKTQEQLGKMTEQDITFELACLIFGEDECYKTQCLQVAEVTSGAARYVDISDWSWLMPLAIKNDVTYNITYCLAGGGQVFTAMSMDMEGTHSDYCETPQRAIAICLILKLQEIQE